MEWILRPLLLQKDVGMDGIRELRVDFRVW